MNPGSHSTPGPQRDLIGYGPNPPAVRWPGDATLALNLVINYEEGSEYSHASGDRRNEDGAELPSGWGMGAAERDLCSESVFEYGSRAGVWRLLRLLDEYDVKGTVFACAVAIEQNPAVGEWIRRAEHDVLSHGWRWSKTWELTRDAERERIARAVESLTRTCGTPPSGWYCRYAPSVNTRELVAEHGEPLIYDSDAYNDDLPYFTQAAGKRHLVVPYNSLPYNDARVTSGMTPADYVDMCKRGIDEYRREGLAGHPKMMSIGLHTRWAGQAGRAAAVREIIEYALSHRDIWIARRVDIARWWLDNHASFDTEAAEHREPATQH